MFALRLCAAPAGWRVSARNIFSQLVKILLISQGDPLGGNNKVFDYNSILCMFIF